MMNVRDIVVALAGLALLESLAQGQCDEKQLHEFPSGKQINMGSPPIAIDGDTLLLQPGVNYPGQVYERLPSGTWQHTADLVPSDGSPTGNYGDSADLSGNRIVIGAPGAGAAYVFERSAGIWTQAIKLVGPPGSANFGSPVAISNDTVCVSYVIPATDERAVGVYSFNGTTWTNSTALLVPGLPSQAQFGARIDVDGFRIAVASYSEQVSGQNEGAVRIFELEGGLWKEKAKVVPGNIFGSLQFGRSISLRGGRLLVSGYYLVGFGSAVPAAFLFDHLFPFWIQSAIITPLDASQQAEFGMSVALGEEFAAVSAPMLNVANKEFSGAVYVYVPTGAGWSERLKLTREDAAPFAYLGRDISASGQEIIATSEVIALAPVQIAAVLFSAVPNPAPAYGTACPGTAGLLPTLNLKNTYDGCLAPGNGVAFEIQHANPGGTCLLFLGLNTTSLPLPNGCTLWTLPLTSASLPLFGTGGPGSGSVSFSATIPATLPPVSLYFQGFLPDAGAPAGYSATNGLRLTVN